MDKTLLIVCSAINEFCTHVPVLPFYCEAYLFVYNLDMYFSNNCYDRGPHGCWRKKINISFSYLPKETFNYLRKLEMDHWMILNNVVTLLLYLFELPLSWILFIHNSVTCLFRFRNKSQKLFFIYKKPGMVIWEEFRHSVENCFFFIIRNEFSFKTSNLIL